MNTSRRIFLQKSAVLLAGAAMAPKIGLAAPRAGEILGIQLYSVRDEMLKNPVDTLTQLAKIGYKHVEHANYVDRKF